jgi:hypothetical protein
MSAGALIETIRYSASQLGQLKGIGADILIDPRCLVGKRAPLFEMNIQNESFMIDILGQ